MADDETSLSAAAAGHPLQLVQLPDELIQAILAPLSLGDLITMDNTCKRVKGLSRSLLEYRRHCVEQFRHWEPHHNLPQRLRDPPAVTNWRQLLVLRKTASQRIRTTFESILSSQAGRTSKGDLIVSYGNDAKDFLLEQLDTPNGADDYLARTWWAQTLLSQVERRTALHQWTRSCSGPLERALACIDLCIIPRPPETLDQVEQHFDRIADVFLSYVDSKDAPFEAKTPRQRILLLIHFLRKHHLLGLSQAMDTRGYHRLQNALISVTLCEKLHSSLPLVSAAVFCAVARRIGFDAYPVNYPAHIYAVVSVGKSADVDLNGDRVSEGAVRDDPSHNEFFMYLNPYSDDKEVPYERLHSELLALRVPQAQRRAGLLPETNTLVMLYRMSNNLEHTIEADESCYTNILQQPDYESGFIPPSALDSSGHIQSTEIGGPSTIAHTLSLIRILCYPQPAGIIRAIIGAVTAMHVEHFLSLQTVRDYLLPVLPEGSSERALFERTLQEHQTEDDHPPTPKRRVDIANISQNSRQHPVYLVGTYFKHQKYQYQGAIIGWTAKCESSEAWMTAMKVDELPRGRQQPFYHVIDWEGGSRYVAEENIVCLGRWQGEWREETNSAPVMPSRNVLRRAGEWFKRWDEGTERFVSNLKEEYPDD